jgi:hypothetical protein
VLPASLTVERGQVAVLRATVDLDRAAHVLPVGLERGPAAAREDVQRHALLGDVGGPDVVDLVVIEGHQPREVRVRGLQVRVGLVLRVALAVVLQVDDLVVGVRPHVAAARGVGI